MQFSSNATKIHMHVKIKTVRGGAELNDTTPPIGDVPLKPSSLRDAEESFAYYTFLTYI
jgi:hypothetical protein